MATFTNSTLFFAAGVQTGLTVQSGGAATATGTTFHTADVTTVAISVEEGGKFNVAGSRLVGADGAGATPFACDGAWPACTEAHDGPAAMDGPAAVSAAASLVCETSTGACRSDFCANLPDWCNGHGTCANTSACTCAATTYDNVPYEDDGEPRRKYIAAWTGARCGTPPDAGGRECCSTHGCDDERFSSHSQCVSNDCTRVDIAKYVTDCDSACDSACGCASAC
jgi:hypothetical protein